MSQKICVISFDHWHYDHHIVSELCKLGHDAHHIKIGQFKYKNNWERVKNSLSKIFLGKNPKIKKRQEYILETLKKLGTQDQILVINPELIEKKYHLEIKKYTRNYIAYLYDSVARNPVEHLLKDVFNTIFSFDKNDVQTFGFLPTTNYIYFDAFSKSEIKQDFIYIGSIDDRIDILNKIGNELVQKNYSFKFYAIGKKSFKFNLVKSYSGKYKNIIFQKKRFSQNETLQMYNESNCIIDIVRNHQSGLSFRFFEAMGLKKILLTNNNAVINYDFYQNNSIILYNENWLNDYKNKKEFVKFDNEIIKKYELKNWIQNIFNLS